MDVGVAVVGVDRGLVVKHVGGVVSVENRPSNVLGHFGGFLDVVLPHVVVRAMLEVGVVGVVGGVVRAVVEVRELLLSLFQ